ncbi:MAG: isoprenyl transferase [Rhodospirillaceae bacterium]|nr:isoprenyl transferase [Rhodospirillaceae bacterium]
MSPGDSVKNFSVQLSKEAEPPAHVAIIMDGNGRWAKKRHMPRTAGHQRGAQSVKKAIKAAVKAGVSYLTMYGFSSENWKRSNAEIKDLMGLLRFYLKNEISTLLKEGVRFQVIGDRDKLDEDIVQLIEESEAKTVNNTRLVLTIALSYGGRAEIVRATRKIAEKVRSGDIEPENIDEEMFEESLFTAGMPDPDILIRTSGEQRMSNFLPWQLAYAEFFFLDVLWPDFSEDDFNRVLDEYHGRERRFGATGG